MRRVLIQEMLGQRAMSVGDVGVYGRDINNGHDGVRWVGIDHVKEMVCILNREGRDLAEGWRWASM